MKLTTDARYKKILVSALNSQVHQNLALEAAHQSIVLLKNTNNTLPMAPGKAVKSIAVVGPSANCTFISSATGQCNQLGNYATAPPFVVTPADGLAAFFNVVSSHGTDYDGTDRSNISSTVAAVDATDAAVLVIGLAVGRDWEHNLESSHEGEAGAARKARAFLLRPQSIKRLLGSPSVAVTRELTQ